MHIAVHSIKKKNRQVGFTLVEIILASALMLLVFSALFAGFQTMIEIVGISKSKAGALALATERMEYLRSLPYDSLGTDGGVPSGALPQNATTTLNGRIYNERLLIQYIDDAADGIGGADTNFILADYKQIKVVYTWHFKDSSGDVDLVSNIVPKGIESTAGGGTIRVNVFNASVNPLVGAEVRFVNNTTTTTIDTLRYTDLAGVTYLSGAPAASNYEITVTDTGYSTDGTHVVTTSNPNPTTLPIAVLASQVSTMNFQIDLLSDLLITTVGTPTYDTFTDLFIDTSLLFIQASTSVVSEGLVLQGSPGTYPVLGTAQGTSTSPATIDSWYSLIFSATSSASTSLGVSILYDNAGIMESIPDWDLPGNSAGFTTSPIDLSNLDLATYSTLSAQFTLHSNDATYTPEVYDYTFTHIQSQPAISGVSLTVAGAKSIGTDGVDQPVLKYQATGISDGNGQWEQNNIEWDVYTVSMNTPAYRVYEACPTSPYSLSPNVHDEITLTLGGVTTQFLRVSVESVSGVAIANASVHLENIGVDQTNATSLCGQTYFNSGLYNDNNYVLTVSAPGFGTQVFANTTVNSSSTVNVILN